MEVAPVSRDDAVAEDETVSHVKLTKQNTIIKLIDKLWDGRITREVAAQRLPEELWEKIRDIESKESMQRVAKTITNKFKKGLRDEKRECRHSRKASREHMVLQRYSLLALPVRELTSVDRIEIEWLKAPRPVIPELNCHPPRRYFALRQWDLLKRELQKLREKRSQIEYLAAQVLRRVESSRNTSRPIKRIVDFGGGRGDFSLALWWLLHKQGQTDITLTMVEIETSYCSQGEKRAAALQKLQAATSAHVNKLRIESVSLEHYNEPFDLAVGLHCCGPLVDAVVEKCIANLAEFVFLTCCFGKICKRGASLGLEYPRAGGTLVRGKEDFFDLCRIADGPASKESAQAMRIVNSDRCSFVRQLGGWALLSEIPRSITNKNMLVSGTTQAMHASSLDVEGDLLGLTPVDKECDFVTQGVRLSNGPPQQESETLRVVMIADTHCRQQELTMPPGDLLLVCGDITKSGTLAEVEDFALWLDKQPYKEKVVVAGNHEITFEPKYYASRGFEFHKRPGEIPSDLSAVRRILSERKGVHYLEDDYVCLEFGNSAAPCPVGIYGSPCQGPFFDGHSMAAFTLTAEQEQRIASSANAWHEFTTHTEDKNNAAVSHRKLDILITHGPPFGLCDLSTEHGSGDGRACHAGSRAILAVSKEAKPLLHAFGHIHEGYGVQTDGTTYFANSAICSERYVAQRLPLVTDIPKGRLSYSRSGLSDNVPGVNGNAIKFWRAKPASLSTYGDSGRPKHAEDAVSPLYRRLMETLHAAPELHSKTRGSTGYRNKASYSLGSLFALQESCEASLNELALWLQSEVEASANPTFWVEAAIKLTRRGTLGLKLVLRGESEAATWLQNESLDWWNRLQKTLPSVTSVTYQVAPENSDEKPPKSPWHPRYPMPKSLFGKPFVIEETPRRRPGVAGLPFRLSPDAFSEVNHAAEDAMFQTLCEWVSGLRQRGEAVVLGMFGRNCGFLGLAMQDAFAFDKCYAYTHCPVTLADVEASLAMNPEMQKRWITGQSQKYDFGATLAAIPQGQGPMLVHVTNSRHGLADGIVPALKARRDVFAVAYNSCSHLPLAGEWQELCCGAGAFEVKEFRSFDLLAGTEFESSYFLLVRRQPILMLPIGPPGVGKSWLARQLSVVCNVFERDRVFFEERMREEVSFAVAKQRTHDRLMEAIERAESEGTALLLDSTNGSQQAREAYASAFPSARPVYIVLRPGSEDFILRRLRHRESSAETPVHERTVGLGGLRPDAPDADILAKVSKVVSAVEYPELGQQLPKTTHDDKRPAPMILNINAEDPDACERALWRCFLLLVCPVLAELDAKTCPASDSFNFQPLPRTTSQ